MATYYDRIIDEQADLIRSAPLFFVATADPDLASGPHEVGPVNLSPRGGQPLHILDPNRVAFLDYAGSGNETARHTQAGGPITVMVCSFTPDAAIIRLFGKATVTPVDQSPLADILLPHKTAEERPLPPRQIVEVQVEKTMISCGYGVPIMQFVRDRTRDDRGRRYKEKN